MRNYETIIGLEIHVELKSNTKAFCSCKHEFGALPNTQVCPVCLGLPGALPKLNKKAFEYCIMAGLSFGCDISPTAVFERKNYFYPDLPKSYQITQLKYPICTGGGIALKSNKFIRFNRIQLEEDAGKLIHGEDNNQTLIDFNRAGVPILEMVTEPDFRDSMEVVEFLQELKKTLIYSGVSKCKMEEGGFRFDINISVKPVGEDILGNRVEIKNLNTFTDIEKAIEYETNRQIELIENGGQVATENRAWDNENNSTFAVRIKETENDYRHFPDPDILTINIQKSDINRLMKLLPELVSSRRQRYIGLGLSEYDVGLLTNNKIISDYFDEVYALTDNAKESANWITTEVFRVSKDRNCEHLSEIISAENLANIIKLVLNEELTRVNAKVLFDEVVTTGADAITTLKKLDLIGDVNKKDVVDIMGMIINENPDIIETYRSSPDEIINFCIGSIVKNTNGKAKIEHIRPLIIEIIKSKIK